MTDPKEPRDALVAAFDALLWEGDYNDADRLLAKLDDVGWRLVQTETYEAPAVGWLLRREDETGVSGTGMVAWIVEFPDGVTVTRWAVTEVRQTCVWRSTEDVMAIHGHGGKTDIRWADDLGAPWTFGRPSDLDAQ